MCFFSLLVCFTSLTAPVLSFCSLLNQRHLADRKPWVRHLGAISAVDVHLWKVCHPELLGLALAIVGYLAEAHSPCQKNAGSVFPCPQKTHAQGWKGRDYVIS